VREREGGALAILTQLTRRSPLRYSSRGAIGVEERDVSMARWDVLGFGAVAVDDLIYVDRFPYPDGKTAVRESRREGGGLAGTAMVAAARLGVRAAYCGVLGDDERSQFTRAEFERQGVDLAALLHDPQAEPIHSTVVVERATGNRVIFFDRRRVIQPPLEQIDAALIGATRVLLVDFTALEAGLRAARLARELGVPVVGDIERSDYPTAPELVAVADHLILGLEIARMLTGREEPEEAARALLTPDRAVVVVTAGGGGGWYVTHESEVAHVPALAVQVVDTTGCGDVFHGAYAAWLALGRPLAECVRAATVAAGLKAEQPGGRAGIPDRATVEQTLARLS